MEPAFHFVCGIRGCLHSFKVGSTYSSFKSHASRKHPNWQESVNDEAVERSPPLTPSLSEDLNSQILTLTQSGCPILTGQEFASGETACSLCTVQLLTTPPLSCPSAQRAAALFLLTFQEKYKLSQSAINFAVGSINTIVDSVCESTQSSLQEALATGDVDAMKLYLDELESPFAQLQTEYKQSKFYREHFGLVVSLTDHALVHT